VDIAVNLIENYLRLTGYLTLSEFEVQRRHGDTFRAVTDVDIMAMRLPGAVFLGDPHDDDAADLLLIEDPELGLEADTVDVIIGEVKQGQAILNPGIRQHAVLHSMLRRVEWVYAGGIDEVVDDLAERSVCHTEARGGGVVRTRLVAFGRSDTTDLNTISLSHVITTMLGFFEQHEEAFRPIQMKEPAPALLRLLLKAGFDVGK
jgi:hypothetical protein